MLRTITKVYHNRVGVFDIPLPKCPNTFNKKGRVIYEYNSGGVLVKRRGPTMLVKLAEAEASKCSWHQVNEEEESGAWENEI